jgi:hypothetical protein
LKRKAAGYKAAVRVETNRAAAVELRETDPALYAQVLAQADGSEAEEAARRDPDAYVALFLAAWKDEGGGAQPTAEAEGERDIDYWPTLDLDAAWAEVTKTFHEGIEERGRTQLYFPNWIVRRMIAFTLMSQVLVIRPELADEADALFFGAAGDAEPMREDDSLDEALDAFMARNHLSQIVAAFVQGLSAEE